MRVLVIGGTEFIGRRIVEMLASRGDELLVVHRGRTEPESPTTPARHLHVDRRDFGTVADQVKAFRPDAVVDTYALTAADTKAVVDHLPDVPSVVLSSIDVYEAYGRFMSRDHAPTAMPIDEDAPLREERYPYRGSGFDPDDYEKLDVEPHYLARNGTVLRLGMVHGPHDGQRREEPILRRIRAGRTRIPFGPGETLFPRLHVDDAASATLAVTDKPDAAAGQVFNICEATGLSVRGWAETIVTAAGSKAELVRVPDDALPDDLAFSRSHTQHLITSSAKAAALLDWRPGDPFEGIDRSVRWHLANPPADASSDFADDEAALGR